MATLIVEVASRPSSKDPREAPPIIWAIVDDQTVDAGFVAGRPPISYSAEPIQPQRHDLAESLGAR
jgi:hypothetical protein